MKEHENLLGGRPLGHPKIPEERVGLLLINLGTPDATDFWSIRRYLRQFLSDPRVIEVNPLFWQVILNLVILNTRPAITAKAYRKIWDKETNESPLRRFTREQAEGLGAQFASGANPITVDWAMRYGNPSIASRLEVMRSAGCRKILLFALYPQYSATTTATAYDNAFLALARMRWQPAVRTVPAFPDETSYINGVAGLVRQHIDTLDWEPDLLLASFHGLPKRYFDEGDPYHCHCALTTRLLGEALGWSADRVRLAFQSRFGRAEWLRPYIQDLMETLPSEGIKRIAVVCPGFVSDCIETLEEVGIGLHKSFLDAGGESFAYIPCLNSREGGIEMLEKITLRELSGWIPTIQNA